MDNQIIKVSRGGKIIGSFTAEELIRKLQQGELLASDYYWRPGMSKWESLAIFISTNHVTLSEGASVVAEHLPTKEVSLPPPLPASALFHASTDNRIPGYKVTHSLGVVIGICVRSSTFGQTFKAGIQGFFDEKGGLKDLSEVGGRRQAYEEMCEQTRRVAYEKMIHSAKKIGADAVVVVRYESVELASTVAANPTEIMCYGTAVKLVPVSD